jgi:hypothetical protein
MLCVCAMCACLCGSFLWTLFGRVSHPTRHDDLQTLLWGPACTCPWSGTCGGGGSGGSIAINASVLVGNGSLYAHGGQVSPTPPSQIQLPSYSFRGRATCHPHSSIACPSLRRYGSYLHDARAALRRGFPCNRVALHLAAPSVGQAAVVVSLCMPPPTDTWGPCPLVVASVCPRSWRLAQARCTSTT